MNATKIAGLVKIGEFGFSNGDTGTMYATLENVAAVRAEWNEIEDDDTSRAAIQPAIAVGGIWIPDRVEPHPHRPGSLGLPLPTARNGKQKHFAVVLCGRDRDAIP